MSNSISSTLAVHPAFFRSWYAQCALEMGFSLADTWELHREVFATGDDVARDDDGELLNVFRSALIKKMDGLSEDERERMRRRANFFGKVPLGELKLWGPADWQRAAGEAERQTQLKPVSPLAALRRYNRAHRGENRVYKLRGGPKGYFRAAFALKSGNVILPGGIADLEEWCRNTGVISDEEVLSAIG